ncbi:multiple epidermal growth factor-like domains protein 10 [Saccostrea cucullata]|uniref:multiple epidermal growth factor-like domains protein 10 n=1 Tax=Saccostrea cuccullata TaxID=36930 RepID=UPI002ED183A6
MRNPDHSGKYSQCEVGLYGLECNQTCSRQCLDNTTCSNVNGNCKSGCEEGFGGMKCEEECELGNYGMNCAFSCSGNCLRNLTCNRFSGKCEEGCIAGYTGVRCDEECSPMTFGPKCKHICSGHCAESHTCNHVTGICANGCADGYNGSLCDAKCVEGYFGTNCIRRWSQNCKNTCNHVSGICFCSTGFSSDPYCMKVLKGEQTSETNSKPVALIFSVGLNVLLLCSVVFLIRTIQIKRKTESRKRVQNVEPLTIENSMDVHYQDLETVDQSFCYQELQTKENKSFYQNYS